MISSFLVNNCAPQEFAPSWRSAGRVVYQLSGSKQAEFEDISELLENR